MVITKRISKRIRMFRKERGLSRRLLAYLSGVPIHHLKSIEKRKIRPHVETVKKIAKALEISLFDLTSKGSVYRDEKHVKRRRKR